MSVSMVKELINGLNIELSQKINGRNKKYIETRNELALNHSLKEYSEWVIKTVSEKYGYTVEQMKQKSRGKDRLVLCRYIAMSIIDDNTHFESYSAKYLNRDRTTYYNMLDQLEGLLLKFNHKRIFEQLKNECSLQAYSSKYSVDNKA